MTLTYQIPDVVFPHREVPQPVIQCNGCGLAEWLFPPYGQKTVSKVNWGFRLTANGMVNWCSDGCRNRILYKNT